MGILWISLSRNKNERFLNHLIIIFYMELQFDFNKPGILNEYLKQGLAQKELGNFADRMVVGSEGGLMYTLFPDRHQFLPKRFGILRLTDFSAISSYFVAVERYIKDAGELVKEQNFGLVKVNSDGVIINGFELGNFIHEVGLGSVNIESSERLEAFLEMVGLNKDGLDKQLAVLSKQAKYLPTIKK